jgi:hypothetical protein
MGPFTLDYIDATTANDETAAERIDKDARSAV